jgi:hypothetical protein
MSKIILHARGKGLSIFTLPECDDYMRVQPSYGAGHLVTATFEQPKLGPSTVYHIDSITVTITVLLKL